MVRWKRRYFVLEVKFEDSSKKFAKSSEISKTILENVTKMYGEYGTAFVSKGFQIKYFNGDTGILYLRVSRNVHQMVTAVIPLVTSIRGDPCSISCLFTAATIRHANIFMKKYHEKAVAELCHGKLEAPSTGVKKKILDRRKRRV